MTADLQQLRYPIGKFQVLKNISPDNIKKWIDEIEALPPQIRQAIADWSDEQLDTPYRPQGWTVRQVIHHIADSHINSYVRFKWTLTEDKPTIKAYNEKLWAELPEAKTGPVDLSLYILDALHRRWVVMLRQLSASDLKRIFVHPESSATISLEVLISLYAWHGKHHLTHITSLKKRKGW